MPEQYDEWYSSIVLDANGSRVGSVSQVYLDDASGEPTFLVARTGLFGNKEVCVPVNGALFGDGVIQVPHAGEVIKMAPAPAPQRHLEAEQEADVYRHYGLPFTMPDQLPSGSDAAASAGQAAAAQAPVAREGGAVPAGPDAGANGAPGADFGTTGAPDPG